MPEQRVQVRESDGAVTFPVHVQPRARRTELAGMHGGSIKLRVTAPAVEDAANHAVVEFFAALAGVPRSAVRIVRGRRSREKTLQIDGMTWSRLLSLTGLAPSPGHDVFRA